ncbi:MULTISPECIES: hypothetical protein [unclassified Janibacter]|uniref:hypothetical protein n=1 Tax=unclassified Janibacter TaxID=2649294 RepID=UPI003CFD25A7
MTELFTQLRARATESLSSLAEARRAGDDYSVRLAEADLENIARLANEHGLVVPELASRTA